MVYVSNSDPSFYSDGLFLRKFPKKLRDCFQHINKVFKAGHRRRQITATRYCNTLLQQIALCVQSSDKSYALIAAIGCSDKSPGVNVSTFGGWLRKILSPAFKEIYEK